LQELPDWDRLDAAAFRVSMKRSVRWLAWFLAVLGGIALGCGLASAVRSLTIVGAVLFVAGAWNLGRTSLSGLVVDGLAMIVSGAFLTLAGFWTIDSRSSAVGKWIFAGGLQVIWGVRRLALYRTARGTRNDRQAIGRLEDLVHQLSRRRAKDDPSVAEFWTGRIRRHRNRLGLYAEGVIGLLDHQAVRLEKRGDIWIEVQGTTAMGRWLKVKVQMSDLELTGRMPPAHFERFERWKLGQTQPRTIAA